MKTEVSQEQIYALKEMILRASADEDAKKIIFALIDASNMLTVPVAYTVYSKKTIRSIETIMHFDEKIRLNLIMKLLGANFDPHPERSTEMSVLINRQWKFTHHDGYFSKGEFIIAMRPGKECSRTIWLSFQGYDHEAIEITAEDVEKTELVNIKPELVNIGYDFVK